MSSFALKAYATEEDAIKDTNVLKRTSGTDWVINKEQANSYNFYTHEKYFFRIESNEPVKEFYIDWDDGEDNNPKGNANYTLIKFDSPQSVGITSHIFTRDKLHYPKIRVKSVDGYLSKFYTSYRGAEGNAHLPGTFTGIDTLQGDTDLPRSRNNTYRIESDSATERVPAFGPTPKPPVGILKADKKRVYAGITNKYLSGPTGIHNSTGYTCTLYGSTSQIDTVRAEVDVRISYHTAGPAASHTDRTQSGLGELRVTDIRPTGTLSNVLKVVKIELLELLEDTNTASSGSGVATKLYPGEKLMLVRGTANYDERPCIIGEVSLGNPIIELDDPKNTVTLDATESFARCPETTIDEYRIWDGDKLTDNGYELSEPLVAEATAQTSDVFAAGAGTDTLRMKNGVLKASYAFHPHKEFVDSDYRWLPKQMLGMTQVIGSTAAVKADTSGPNDTNATFTHSWIEHWSHNPSTYANSDTGKEWPTDMHSKASLSLLDSYDNDDWLSLQPRNKLIGERVNESIITWRGSASHDSDMGETDVTQNNVNSMEETGDRTIPMIITRSEPWTRQWWEVTSANDLWAAEAWKRAGKVLPGRDYVGSNDEWTGVGHQKMRANIFYTAYDGDSYAWKPLKIINGTKHPDYDDTTWYTTGAWEWEQPEDWAKIDPASIPDRFWPLGDYEGDGYSFQEEAGGANFFDATWDNNHPQYGLLVIIEHDSDTDSITAKGYGMHNVQMTFACSNPQSVLIDVIDPMHISLNDRAISQSISYSHKGKYQIIEDRMGKADIRKIGASGGIVKFGGVDLIDGDGATNTRDMFYDYMRKATPVYLDVTHKSGNISRFFGIITNMSEDHPTGNMIPKWAVSLQVSHMIYMNSSGVIQSDGYISLGGDKIDEFKYI